MHKLPQIDRIIFLQNMFWFLRRAAPRVFVAVSRLNWFNMFFAWVERQQMRRSVGQTVQFPISRQIVTGLLSMLIATAQIEAMIY